MAPERDEDEDLGADADTELLQVCGRIWGHSTVSIWVGPEAMVGEGPPEGLEPRLAGFAEVSQDSRTAFIRA